MRPPTHIPDWDSDPQGNAGIARLVMPEGGGWIYRLAHTEGRHGYIFVPDVAAWVALLKSDTLPSDNPKVDQILAAMTTSLTILQTLENSMGQLEDAIAAQSAAITDLTTAVSGVEADLTAEHSALVDALAALKAAADAGSVTPAQVAAVQTGTDAVGALAARLRQVVADTPPPVVDPGAPVIT